MIMINYHCVLISTLTPQFVFCQGTQSGEINQHQMQQLHLSGLMHGSIQLLSTSHSSLTQPSVLLVSTYLGVCGPQWTDFELVIGSMCS